MIFSQLSDLKVVDLYKQCCRYRSEPVKVSSAELADYLVIQLNSEKNFKDPWNAENAKKVAQKETFHKALKYAAEFGFHNYNLKIPNANVSVIGGIIRHPSFSETFPYMTSQTVELEKQYAGVGDAARAFALRFLTNEFVLAGTLKCLGVELTKASETKKQLHRMGLPEKVTSEIGSILQERMVSGEPTTLDRFSKQVFFPLRGQKDVLITPVQHSGLIREFHNRLQTVWADENRVFTRSLKVAGANPINSGQCNAELGGNHRHLLCMPPNFSFSEIRRLLFILEKRKTLFPRDLSGLPWSKDKEKTKFPYLLHTLESFSTASLNNKEIRDRIRSVIRKICTFVFERSLNLKDYLYTENRESILKEDRYKTVPRPIKQFLAPGLYGGATLGRNHIDALVQKAMAVLRYHKKGAQFLLMDFQRPIFEEEFERLIRENQ